MQLARIEQLLVGTAVPFTRPGSHSAIAKQPTAGPVAVGTIVEALGGDESNAVEPLAHPIDMVQRLRPDEVTEEDRRERFQSVAPSVEAGLYLVPRVIE